MRRPCIPGLCCVKFQCISCLQTLLRLIYQRVGAWHGWWFLPRCTSDAQTAQWEQVLHYVRFPWRINFASGHVGGCVASCNSKSLSYCKNRVTCISLQVSDAFEHIKLTSSDISPPAKHSFLSLTASMHGASTAGQPAKVSSKRHLS